MDRLIAAAARALAAGDPLTAMKRVALREDPPALALRGIAMAQIGDLSLARELLRRAARAFGSAEPMARARCILAEAEIALVLRDLGDTLQTLGPARKELEAHGDRTNAAHAAYLEARRSLLIGRLEEAEQALDRLDPEILPPASRCGYWLVATGIAMRRIRTEDARSALDRACDAARKTGIPSLAAETDRAASMLAAPAARLIADGRERPLVLAEVEALIQSGMLVIDACRSILRSRNTVIPLTGRPVLFALARALAEAWPQDVSRESLLAVAFRAKEADESHRARLRVEMGRLRRIIRPLAGLQATERGFRLEPNGTAAVALLAPPVDGEHAGLLALLADGEAWSSSALALAMDVSSRTVQRALEALAEAGKVEWFGHGRARRWIASNVPGFPTSLLLPAPLPKG
ncbi:helix-turn-helix domain-containing protein [Paracoccus methylarcula]|uniref:Helix-turn-helix domain-containing protein n=1 Tax=Paracoccus methylarcula TaxID=72022 RepID=A0A422QYA5_9RHOB|nr:helix-turn-helix domain-containing protein [Paracoccus methylarcula]RNF34977.1 helix-turn-helix domain-containing protein [Paracoccus methylarcula]